MIGIIIPLFFLIIRIIGYFYEVSQNKINSKKYVNKNGLTYIDARGRDRLLSNNNLVYYRTNSDGEYVLKELSSGKVIKNFTKERICDESEKRREIAIKNGKSFYKKPFTEKNVYKRECHGSIYVDIYNGNEYVLRRVNDSIYFMNIRNGIIEKYVCPVYFEIYPTDHEANDKETVNSINAKQKKNKTYLNDLYEKSLEIY